MPDEIENTPSPEEDQPDSDPQPEGESQEQPVDAQGDADAAADDPSNASEDAPAEEEPSDEGAAALAAAMAAVNQLQGVADSAAPSNEESEPVEAGDIADMFAQAQTDAEPFESPVFEDDAQGAPKQGIDLLSDVHMNVRIELGRTKMFVEDVLKLGDGAVVELDKLAGDPVDVFVNDRKVAKGEVLVLNDLFCVRISEIVDISAADD